jgi:hypothetical protein
VKTRSSDRSTDPGGYAGSLYSRLSRSRLAQTALVLYIVVFVIALIPQVYRIAPEAIGSLIQDYRQMLTGHRSQTAPGAGASDSASAATSPDTPLKERLDAIESRVASLSSSANPAEVDKIAGEVRELRALILRDPEKVLMVQSLNFETQRLKDRVDEIASQTRWLFGITVTIALGVLGAVFGLLKSVRPHREAKDESS